MPTTSIVGWAMPTTIRIIRYRMVGIAHPTNTTNTIVGNAHPTNRIVGIAHPTNRMVGIAHPTNRMVGNAHPTNTTNTTQ